MKHYVECVKHIPCEYMRVDETYTYVMEEHAVAYTTTTGVEVTRRMPIYTFAQAMLDGAIIPV